MNRLISLLASAFLTLSLLIAPAHAAGEGEAKAVVESITDEIVNALKTTEGNRDARQSAFEQIFDNRADVGAIGRFVAGRYWRGASKADQQEYLDAYKDFIAFSYAAKMSGYSGETIAVGRVIDAGKKGLIVKSSIKRGNGAPPVSVDWRLKKRGSTLKVIDMIVERVSLAVTQRSEFQSHLRKSGGDLAKLTEVLRQRMGG